MSYRWNAWKALVNENFDEKIQIYDWLIDVIYTPSDVQIKKDVPRTFPYE